MTKKCEEDICKQTSLNGLKMWRHLCPMWMLTKGWPPQRRILIIGWVGWLVLWMPVSFSPQPLMSTSNALMNKVAAVAGMEVMQGLCNRDFCSPRPTCLWPLRSGPICQQQRPTLSLWYDTIPLGDQPATWWQDDYNRLLSSWKGAVFCSYWNRHSVYGLAYPACNALATTTMDLLEYLIHHCGIPRSIISD